MGDGPPPADRLAGITSPTLVATGTVPDAHGAVPREFMSWSADVIASSIPRAERQVIEGAGHMVDAKLVAPVLERFFPRLTSRHAAGSRRGPVHDRETTRNDGVACERKQPAHGQDRDNAAGQRTGPWNLLP